MALRGPSNERVTADAEGFGSLHAGRAVIRAGKGAKREGSAFYLNEEQTLLIPPSKLTPRSEIEISCPQLPGIFEVSEGVGASDQ